MKIEYIFIIIFISCFCFICFQCFEYIQNYDYIVKFNETYSKYEFVASPSYNYVDKSVFDPNDDNTPVNNKWRCVSYDNGWLGLNKTGIIVIDNNYKKWSEKTECYKYIFTTPFMNYNDPCSVDKTNDYCNLINSQKWIDE